MSSVVIGRSLPVSGHMLIMLVMSLVKIQNESFLRFSLQSIIRGRCSASWTTQNGTLLELSSFLTWADAASLVSIVRLNQLHDDYSRFESGMTVEESIVFIFSHVFINSSTWLISVVCEVAEEPKAAVQIYKPSVCFISALIYLWSNRCSAVTCTLVLEIKMNCVNVG